MLGVILAAIVAAAVYIILNALTKSQLVAVVGALLALVALIGGLR